VPNVPRAAGGRFLCAAFLGLIALGGCGEDAFEMRAQEISRRVLPALFECPDRAWPGIAATLREDAQVLLFSASSDRAYVLDGIVAGQPRLAEVELSTVPLTLRTTTWSTGELFGTPTLSISLDHTAKRETMWHDPAVALTLHEAFHALSGQRAWPRSGGGSRGTPYPGRVEPRYLRRALAGSLEAVLSRDEGAELGHAASLHARYATEEAGEAARVHDLDRTEGSAEYFALIGSALGELGCAATDEELDAIALAHLSEFAPTDLLFVGREPYDLGVLAGLLLRRARSSGWEAEVVAGATPVELAVRDVTPLAVEDDPELRARVETSVEEWNEMVAFRIDPFLEELRDPDVTRVVIPGAWGVGTFTGRDFVLLEDLPGTPVALVPFSAELRREGAAILAHEATVLFLSAEATPCTALDAAEIVFVAPVARELLRRNGDVYSSSTPELEIAGFRATEATDDGATWLCPSP
jgi:hypothetical protein